MNEWMSLNEFEWVMHTINKQAEQTTPKYRTLHSAINKRAEQTTPQVCRYLHLTDNYNSVTVTAWNNSKLQQTSYPT